ncbi:RNA-binding protein [Thermoanaerobacterium sp. DL9XJH110]|jgi:ribosomal protein L14E/L6E/L27E|uniref:RNA-binding protein n=1 Tax=Thermoanaerobacterium sp. DL9XJH110 TaxID=3386643 RepID=UPI003BB6DA41
MPELKLGQLVLSCAGRDKGRFMLVIKILDSQYVYVADGVLRRVENPKKKKIKHLKILNKRAGFIAEKIENNKKIYNEEIRRALEELVDLNLKDEESSQV